MSDKFKIKIASTWFSDDYITLKYKNGNQLFWRTLNTYDQDILTKFCSMKEYSTHYRNAEWLMKKFDTFEKIQEYEKEQREKVDLVNKDIAERERKKKKEKKEIYNKFS